MITITAAQIDAEVSAWIAANQTGKRRPGIARIAKALGYARLSVKYSVERIERAAAKAAEPQRRVVMVGMDGASHPQLRYRDAQGRINHNSIVSAADHAAHCPKCASA